MIEDFERICKADFGYFERLELCRTDEPGDCSSLKLAIDLLSSLDGRPRRLRMTFTGVTEIQLKNLSCGWWYRIEIRSIRERQLERLNYHVVEYESDAFEFFCKAFAASVIEPE